MSDNIHQLLQIAICIQVQYQITGTEESNIQQNIKMFVDKRNTSAVTAYITYEHIDFILFDFNDPRHTCEVAFLPTK